MPIHLNSTQFTFVTIGIPHLRLIHQEFSLHGTVSKKYNTYQYWLPEPPYISKLFKRGFEIIQTQAIVPAEAQISSADVSS